MLAASVIWGLSAIVYKELDHVPAVELASHRVLWSFLTFSAIVVAQGRFREISALFGTPRQFGETLFASGMIAVNWLFYIVAIQIGMATEASLGYFIFPLFAVFLGFVLYGEGLTRNQWISVSLTGAAVIMLTVGLKTAPWISILLATTISIYGLVKRRSPAGATISVTAEALLLSFPAAAWLVGVHFLGWMDLGGKPGGHFGKEMFDSCLLALSGLLTAGPLMLMSYATKRLRFSEVGLIQYVNPSLQFLVAVFLFMEPFGLIKLLAFTVIWLALLLYSIEVLRQNRELRRASIASSGS